jgi:predicted nucleic acid-binding protein
MTSTLIDTNVLLDVIEMRPQWFDWAQDVFRTLHKSGDLVVNPVVFAEASTTYADAKMFMQTISAAGLVTEDLPFESGFLAGKAHLAYRHRGGVCLNALPDFFIGAHAAIKGYRLLTRDAARIRTYFPDVELVEPDTHP